MNNLASFSLALILLISGCIPNNLTEKQKSYLRYVTSQPSEFTVKADSAQVAWDRGIKFILKYSNYKIRISSDNLIETYTDQTGYSYSISKVKLSNDVTFTVQSFNTSILGCPRCF